MGLDRLPGHTLPLIARLDDALVLLRRTASGLDANDTDTRNRLYEVAQEISAVCEELDGVQRIWPPCPTGGSPHTRPKGRGLRGSDSGQSGDQGQPGDGRYSTVGSGQARTSRSTCSSGS